MYKKVRPEEEEISSRSLPDALSNMRPYTPPFWYNRHLSSMCFPMSCVAPQIKYVKREYLRDIKEGGICRLDWAFPPRKGRFVVLMLPGLGGSEQSVYVRYMGRAALINHGAVLVVLTSWGSVALTERKPLASIRAFNKACFRDLEAAIKHVSQTIAGARICVVGFSVGSGILVRYLTQRGANAGIVGGLSVCNAMDYAKVLGNLENNSGFIGRMYSRAFAKVERKALRGVEKSKLQLRDQQQTLSDMDKVMCGPAFGYDSIEEYHRDLSLTKVLDRVAVPLVLAQSTDDPCFGSGGDSLIRSGELYYSEGARNVHVHFTPAGGHLSFVEGALGTKCYLEDLADVFFTSMAKDFARE